MTEDVPQALDLVKQIDYYGPRTVHPDWKKLPRLSDRLTPLGTLKHLDTLVLKCLRGFKEPSIRPLMMPRDASLSDSCTFGRCSFSSLTQSSNKTCLKMKRKLQTTTHKSFITSERSELSSS